MLIFGFSGKLGTGKDYVAKHIFLPILQSKLSDKKTLFLGFADRLKEECMARENVTYEDLYGKKTEVIRRKLQVLADEIRTKYGEDYFVKCIRFQIQHHKKCNQVECILLTDVRFPEEIKMIKELGGKVYRIEAPLRNESRLLEESKGDIDKKLQISTHRSETVLDNWKDFDGMIKNDPTDHPEEACQALIREQRKSAMPKDVLSIDMTTLFLR
jgi:phosphomevalonate kinase